MRLLNRSLAGRANLDPVADEVRGSLARKIQERERESEAVIEQPTDPTSVAPSEEDEREGRCCFP